MKLIVLTLLIVLSLPAVAQKFERESYYSGAICKTQLNGQVKALPSGIRPDCETENTIIEFDWAKSPKHYECIGQAVVYANESGKLPVCILLARTPSELSFAYQQRRAINRAGVALKVINLMEWKHD